MLVANPRMVTADMVEDVLKFKRLDGALGRASARSPTANFDGDTQRRRSATASARSKPRSMSSGARPTASCRRATPKGLPPNVEVTTIPDAGHIVHMEKAAEVNKVIAGVG